MHRLCIAFLALFLTLPLIGQQNFSFLTPEQKIGQMTQVAIDVIYAGKVYELDQPPRIDEARFDKVFKEYNVGSILNLPSGIVPNPQEWYEIMQRLQKGALSTGGKIPLLYGQDAIHGPNYINGSTLYPQPLGMAATFNRSLTQDCAAMTAYEMKAASIPWNFSPAMDVGRQPVWPRNWESFGEDLYLNKELGLAMVRGYQGLDPGAKDKVAACLKHFTGYGSPLSGRDRTPVYLPERQLREYYFPQYQATIDAGALTIMINSGEFNGVPAHVNQWLLTDILRGEMGFEGLLVSDWEDMHKLVETHKVAPDLKEAIRLAIEAGMDMSMTAVTLDFADLLYELVQEGKVTESRLDESVRRILAVKVELGLFEKNVFSPADYPKFGSKEFALKSKQAAEEAIILLQNDDDVLPLPQGKKILVTGPTANNMRSLNGGWTYSWQGGRADEFLAKRHLTILEAMQGEFDGQVTYFEGASYDKLTNQALAIKASAEADYIVVCLGELSYTENPGDIDDLELPKAQRTLVHEMARAGKPIILIMASGRPRVMNTVQPLAKSVLYSPYPGPYGGEAIAGILSGRVNPSGKLPLTYPRSTNSFVLYDHKSTEGPMHADPESKFNPLYEFGHGMSYTNWKYSKLELSVDQMTAERGITVSVDLTNAGKRKGSHAVLLFTQDEYASITPSVRRLRNFTKETLAPGETRTISFELTAKDLAFIGLDHEWVTEPGTFKVMVGDQVTQFTYR